MLRPPPRPPDMRELTGQSPESSIWHWHVDVFSVMVLSMPRKPRIAYVGAAYRVMRRGNRGVAIFDDDTDRERFLETLGQACSKTGWIVHGSVLMGNDYHRLLYGLFTQELRCPMIGYASNCTAATAAIRRISRNTPGGFGCKKISRL